jgi:hypothetical protein
VKYAAAVRARGAHVLTFHIEVLPRPTATRARSCASSGARHPEGRRVAQPRLRRSSACSPILDDVDLVLVMSVVRRFRRPEVHARVLSKTRALRREASTATSRWTADQRRDGPLVRRRGLRTCRVAARACSARPTCVPTLTQFRASAVERKGDDSCPLIRELCDRAALRQARRRARRKKPGRRTSEKNGERRRARRRRRRSATPRSRRGSRGALNGKKRLARACGRRRRCPAACGSSARAAGR